MAQDDPLVVVSRLRKLCAAKDAQIEGLTSRVEVLTDDLHDLRRERDYLVTTCSKLEDCAQQSQDELEAAETRWTTVQAELTAADERARAAEAAHEHAEADFARQLGELREAAASERAGAPAPSPAPAPAVAAAPATDHDDAARSMDALVESQALETLARQNAALQAEVEALRDQLIERTEAELCALPAVRQPPTSRCAPQPYVSTAATTAPSDGVACRSADSAVVTLVRAPAAWRETLEQDGPAEAWGLRDEEENEPVSEQAATRARWDGEMRKAAHATVPPAALQEATQRLQPPQQQAVAPPRKAAPLAAQRCATPLASSQRPPPAAAAASATRRGVVSRTPCAVLPAQGKGRPPTPPIAPASYGGGGGASYAMPATATATATATAGMSTPRNAPPRATADAAYKCTSARPTPTNGYGSARRAAAGAGPAPTYRPARAATPGGAADCGSSDAFTAAAPPKRAVQPHTPSAPPAAAPAAVPPAARPPLAFAPSAVRAEPTNKRRPPAAHDEIRALLAAKQSALLAVADL